VSERERRHTHTKKERRHKDSKVKSERKMERRGQLLGKFPEYFSFGSREDGLLNGFLMF
jgi:hypothetical protein